MRSPSYVHLAMMASLGLLAPMATPATPMISIQGGPSYMGGYYQSGHSTPAIFAQVVFDDRAIGHSDFTWSPEVTGGWIDGRYFARYDQRKYTASDHIWLMGGGVRIHYGTPEAWYRPIFFSFEPTLHTGRTPALSSAYEFASTLGWQASHWMMGIRHISNGSLHTPNLGETMLLVGVTF